MFEQETIAAIATSSKNGSISVIRVSGENSFSIVSRIFCNEKGTLIDLNEKKSHTIQYGFIFDGSKKIDNFKLYMKISPAQYILSLRMVNAQSLLENTEYNIGEIAEIVGYDNPLYFSRVFKKEYGVSPAQYRKNLEESTEK